MKILTLQAYIVSHMAVTNQSSPSLRSVVLRGSSHSPEFKLTMHHKIAAAAKKATMKIKRSKISTRQKLLKKQLSKLAIFLLWDLEKPDLESLGKI